MFYVIKFVKLMLFIFSNNLSTMRTCKECNKLNNNNNNRWCNKCNAKRFQKNFKNWTSGNNDIDKFIRHTQLSAGSCEKVLEWIPYDRFKNIEYIAKGGFGKVYRANWIDGYILYWDNENKDWYRYDQNRFVALKSLNNSKNVTLKVINKIMFHRKVYNGITIIKLYGITQDPKTKNYMMVLDYAENGSLRNYLDKNYEKLSWEDKFNTLYYIALGLNIIHLKELHRDLHIGNILKLSSNLFFDTCITDMGLCKPVDYNNNASKNTQNNIYGVLPYIAPEILRGQNYTKASDIYSFGIIMYEVILGLPPYYDVSHDKSLAVKICKGLRPRFNIKIPQLIVRLIKRCLDANPLNRPTSDELLQILSEWRWEFSKFVNMETELQIEEPSTSLGLSYETHSEAIYTSRLLHFDNLPEPKNSNDYYEQNDDIISAKFSESLQID